MDLSEILSVFISAILIWTGWRLLRKKPQRRPKLNWTLWEKGLNNRQITRVEQIPRFRNFPYTVPTIIEGLAFLYKYRCTPKGIRIVDDIVKVCGPICRFSLFNKEIILVTDLSLAQKILSLTDPKIMNKPSYIYDRIFVTWLKNGLLASKVDVWQPHRKILNHCFSYKALSTYVKIMDKHGRDLAKALEANCSKAGTIEGDSLNELVATHSIKIISEIMLGSNSSCFLDCDEFFQNFKGAKKLLMDKVFYDNWFLPGVWHFHPRKQEYERCVSTILKYISKDINKYRKEMEEKGPEPPPSPWEEAVGIRPFRSVMEQMLAFKASDQEIHDEMMTFMSAGHETTVGAMHFFLQHMGENLDVQKKCHEELDNLEGPLSMDDLAELKYLERCIMESLRITPTVPFFARHLSENREIDGFKFPGGTNFAFAPWVLHRAPYLYPNPDVFDPDRWLPEKMKERGSIYSFMPFSYGARNCIGNKFAMMEMKMMLAWVLRYFEVSTKDQHWYDVKMEFEVTLVPQRNYNIVLTKRGNVIA